MKLILASTVVVIFLVVSVAYAGSECRSKGVVYSPRTILSGKNGKMVCVDGKWIQKPRPKPPPDSKKERPFGKFEAPTRKNQDAWQFFNFLID